MMLPNIFSNGYKQETTLNIIFSIPRYHIEVSPSWKLAFHVFICCLKQLLGMTSIFVFSFVMKYCIPEIMIFFFFFFFFLSRFLWNRMLMPSAQCWVDNQCSRCMPPFPDYKTPISSDCFDLTAQDVGICGVKCCILRTCLVYMAIYDLEI